jgi:inner membrane protein
MRFPFLAKLVSIGGIALLVLAPLSLTRGKIEERQRLSQDARASIAESSAGEQRLVAPILRLTCIESYWHERSLEESGRNRVLREERERECPATFIAPASVSLKGRIDLEDKPRYRGIHRVRLYRAPLAVAGHFLLPDAPEQKPETTRRFDRAQLLVPIADARGVKNTPALKLNGKAHAFKPGTRTAALGQGLSADLGTAAGVGKEAAFQFELDLMGMERFAWIPFAKNAQIELASNWPAPSFGGKFLPDERTISAAGFNATWRINEFASGGEAALRDWLARPNAEQALPFAPPALSVNLIEPLNLYLQAYRAAEYGFLFVGLTFLLVLGFELTGSARVHPMQYGLVGLALAVFFLLLIALAEHIGFAYAYGVAALACVGLVTWYAIGMLGGVKRGLGVGAACASLFGVLHMLLRSEDYALLMGALLVFAVLAALMLATRKLDWYGLGERIAAR